ncbi:MAG: nitrile hydratase accessory protein [Hyphomicrobiales bacterium]|nr:MAG: nitrile hydratase accessory protein [Hyphomicrobiales bacterium]
MTSSSDTAPIIITTATQAALDAIPSLPRDDNGPIFAAPWQAQAFAMTVALHEAGLFTWPEWTETFAAEIKRAQAEGDPDLGDTYYLHWLAALETIVTDKGAATAETLMEVKDAWDRAAHATPHGQPIVLGADKRQQ